MKDIPSAPPVTAVRPAAWNVLLTPKADTAVSTCTATNNDFGLVDKHEIESHRVWGKRSECHARPRKRQNPRHLGVTPDNAGSVN